MKTTKQPPIQQQFNHQVISAHQKREKKNKSLQKKLGFNVFSLLIEKKNAATARITFRNFIFFTIFCECTKSRNFFQNKAYFPTI